MKQIYSWISMVMCLNLMLSPVQAHAQERPSPWEKNEKEISYPRRASDIFFAGEEHRFLHLEEVYAGEEVIYSDDLDEALNWKKFNMLMDPYIIFSACTAYDDKKSAECERIAMINLKEFSYMRTCARLKRVGYVLGSIVAAAFLVFAGYEMSGVESIAQVWAQWSLRGKIVTVGSIMELPYAVWQNTTSIHNKLGLYSKDAEQLRSFVSRMRSYDAMVATLKKSLEFDLVSCDVSDRSRHVNHSPYLMHLNGNQSRALQMIAKDIRDAAPAKLRWKGFLDAAIYLANPF